MSNVKTKTKNGSYKGHIVCQIVAVDDNGQEVGAPIMSFGVKKAKAILDNVDGIKRFVQNQSSPSSADNIDVSQMSDDEKNKLLAKLLAT